MEGGAACTVLATNEVCCFLRGSQLSCIINGLCAALDWTILSAFEFNTSNIYTARFLMIHETATDATYSGGATFSVLPASPVHAMRGRFHGACSAKRTSSKT